ncbi:MAG: Asp-tRNA(Asn)/Glu-tRNA(Gln) amidotransferase GatCAB subunit B [Candidatus Marinimicrobia bacterium]|nr:Asp-tRNA(Asn)/Glu-tRNA(Gln) amidotransferase GatCAB subunit B [Candidatus Neomarinimicrobiota bacterium]|tara:strand:- start:1320 stop:2759 length:1440 start_codon:yes stop_codon:yes gene_type:complete
MADSSIRNWEAVIGLEIHVQLQTQTKMFSSCKWNYGESPNTLTCPLTMAYPGSLPTINKKAVDSAIMIGNALKCKINKYSEFSRKHYFYPDLPKGYQISQFDKPICGKGNLKVEVNKRFCDIGITRAHLEEDAGKLIHTIDGESLVDYNRAGAPLIEIVTEPDFRDVDVVIAFLKLLKNTIEYINVSDCDMEKGNLRVDLNVSLMKKGSSEFGVRREIKNLNSFKSISRAIKYEINEQSRILDLGGEIKQSTMIWDEINNKSTILREKEDAHDYRYFPEPDLLPLILSNIQVESISDNMPELPMDKKARFKKVYSINSEDANFLIADKNVANYFEELVDLSKDCSQSLNWIRTHVTQVLNKDKISILDFKIKPNRLSELIYNINNNNITNENAKKVFEVMLKDDRAPNELINDLGLKVSRNINELSLIVEKIMNENNDEFIRLKNGETKLVKFFIGQVMKETKGKYPPPMIIKEINGNI